MKPVAREESNSISTNNTNAVVQTGKSKKTEEELARERELKDIEKYVSEMESRNMELLPTSYDRAISRADITNVEDLEKIDLNDFMGEPTEGDYEQVMKKIEEFDKKLDSEQIEESIDLEEIVNDDEDSSEGKTHREEEVYL